MFTNEMNLFFFQKTDLFNSLEQSSHQKYRKVGFDLTEIFRNLTWRNIYDMPNTYVRDFS